MQTEFVSLDLQRNKYIFKNWFTRLNNLKNKCVCEFFIPAGGLKFINILRNRWNISVTVLHVRIVGDRNYQNCWVNNMFCSGTLLHLSTNWLDYFVMTKLYCFNIKVLQIHKYLVINNNDNDCYCKFVYNINSVSLVRQENYKIIKL